MKKDNRISSQEIGLDVLLTLNSYFFKTKDLHYGYWTDGMEVDIRNFPKAQEAYIAFLLSHVPEGTKSVLDVGCGTGRVADRLLGMGMSVDCVSPSPYLTGHARELLGDRSRIFECRYEELETDNRYDLVIFSESFQYIGMQSALENSQRLLKDGGHVLICDFFKTGAPGRSPLGGGHNLAEFNSLLPDYPFKSIKDLDITRHTAPTMDLVADIMTRVARPIVTTVGRFAQDRYPLICKILKWKYRKKLEKLNYKHFSGTRNAESFSIYKTYRLMLLGKKTSRAGT